MSAPFALKNMRKTFNLLIFAFKKDAVISFSPAILDFVANSVGFFFLGNSLLMF